MTTSRLRRALGRWYREQVYAWERLFRVGLPEPPPPRHSASFRRWERELTPGR
jgi:hypothetical protein